jgi:serine protease Do
LTPGTKVDLQVLHNGSSRTAAVTLGTMPGTEEVAQLGLSLARAATVEGAGNKGVVVTDVDPGGAAAKRGFEPGDVILGVNGKRVSTPEDVSEDIDHFRVAGKSSVLMRVQSGKGMKFVALPLGAV